MNLVAGATPKSYLDCLVDGLNFNYEESQMNFFTLYHQGISFETRINNFWGGSALFFDKNLWQLIQRGYTNRHIMVNNKKGRIKYFNSEKLRNMKNTISDYKDHLKDCAYSNREYKRRRNALYNLIFSFPLLHFQNKIRLLNSFIPYFRQEWINEMASRATGNRVCLWQTPTVGLLYDLDADKSGISYDYEFVKNPKNFAHLRERQLKLYDKYLNLEV